MKQQWQEGSVNFLKLTSREQYLILITGLVAVCFIIFYLFIDNKMASNINANKKIAQLSSNNQSLKISVLEVQAALKGDPNEETRNQIAQYQDKLAKVDNRLLALTSDLMSPTQMRYALLDLLKLEKGVSLLSFELLGAQPLLSETTASPLTDDLSSNTTSNATQFKNDTSGINLYRHGIKIKLSGRYFELRDYLTQLEKLQWKFFWQDFNFTLTEYPNSELEIEMYSLGTKKEFIGV